MLTQTPFALVDHNELLALCDRLRDEDMVELGVMLDDREGGRCNVDVYISLQLLTISIDCDVYRRQGSRKTGQPRRTYP